MPTHAEPERDVRAFAPLALVLAALLTNAQVRAANRACWTFPGWDSLAYDDRSVATRRRLTRSRIVAGGGRGDATVNDDAVHPAVLRRLAAYAKAAPGERDAVVAGILEDLDAALRRLERPGRRAGRRRS
jgi:hypothetical protein